MLFIKVGKYRIRLSIINKYWPTNKDKKYGIAFREDGKIPGHQSESEVSFENEEERDKVIKKLDNAFAAR